MKVSRNSKWLIPLLVILMMAVGLGQPVHAQDVPGEPAGMAHCLVDSEYLQESPGITFDLRTPANMSVKIDRRQLPPGEYNVVAQWCNADGDPIGNTTIPVPEGQVVVVKPERPSGSIGSVLVRVIRGLDLRSGASGQATWTFMPALKR